MITIKVYNIRTFNAIDKVCSVLSIGVRLSLPPSFFTLEYDLHILNVPMSFLTICGVLCITGPL